MSEQQSREWNQWPKDVELVNVRPSEACDEAVPSSPIPLKRPNMGFPEAIQAVLTGKRITRAIWGDRDAYGLLYGGLLVLHKTGEAEGRYHGWLVSDGDLFGTDWVVL